MAPPPGKPIRPRKVTPPSSGTPGPANSIVDQARGELNLVGPEKKDDDKKKDPSIWIGSRTKNYPSGQSTVDREVMPLSTMQRKVLSAGARRLPSYYDLAGKLLRSNFITRSSARYPGGVAGGLANAAEVYQAYAADGGTMNFTQWLDWYSSNAEPSGSGGGRGGYGGPTTTTSVTLTDEVTAEALLDRFSRDLLGRGLTEKETEKYLKQFRKQEMSTPQVTTTTSGRGTASQVTETAASKEELLRQILVRNPDYEKYQLDTTIMDMLIDDIEKGKKVIYG
jgi:hypothetical protein